MKYKVLHVVLSMETGGLENGIVNLINNADADRFIVDVLCLREKGTLADRIHNPNSQVIFDGNNDPSLLTAIKKVYKVCKEGQYHIVHSHGFSTMLASYLATRLTKTPVMMNGEHGTLYYSSLKQRALQRWLFKSMDTNLTVSSELKSKIQKEFRLSLDNIIPIINGVDSNTFRPELNSSIRNELSIPDQDIIIGSVGRLVSVKNYPSLINAFFHGLQKSSHTHLVFAGDGPERNTLEKLANDLNLRERVHFLGRRDDIPNVMNGFDLFVLPSFSEGLSNTLLEAMSCGVPVIASHVGGNPEIVKVNVSGLLYPSNDVEALSKILCRLCNSTSEIEKLSTLAREHIVKNYSLQSMVDNYESVYDHQLTKNNVITTQAYKLG
jgi:sugar transferase (PEP-CTERM/EpsH1 system associated)